MDEEDPLVIAIKKSLEKQREKPPEVHSKDYIVDISFHPCEDIIAAAAVTGDVNMYVLYHWLIIVKYCIWFDCIIVY